MGFKQIPRIPVGADLSRTPPIYRPLPAVPLSRLIYYNPLSALAGCSAIQINKVKNIICIQQTSKNYGANAPQLHPIFPVANQPGNHPQLALPGAFCYTLVYSRINLFLLFRALPILPRQEKESNQWRPGGKEL
jgi:hypothetical protein